jgi:hypothetical protein
LPFSGLAAKLAGYDRLPELLLLLLYGGHGLSSHGRGERTSLADRVAGKGPQTEGEAHDTGHGIEREPWPFCFQLNQFQRVDR